MFRQSKFFYIALVALAVLLGLCMPLWFLYTQALNVMLAFDRWGIPGLAGVVFYVATAGAASAATLIFTHASNHLEIKEANTEH